MSEIVGLGQCCVDYLTIVREHPDEDMKTEFDRLLIQGGGPVATALVCLARLGHRPAVIGRVGDDCFGLKIREELAAEGVDTRHLLVRQGSASQFSFILANPGHATRTIFWTRGTAGSVEPNQLPAETIRRARLLHLDGLWGESSFRAAQIAAEAGVTVVLDAGTLRPHSLKLARLVDHLVVSKVFADQFGPGSKIGEVLKRLVELGPATAVVTLGAGGSVGFDGDQVVQMPAYRVEVVDTTGAGDAYHGGYIHALLAGRDLAGRMRFASAVAALSTTALGGRTALPDLGTVEAFLQKNAEQAVGRDSSRPAEAGGGCG